MLRSILLTATTIILAAIFISTGIYGVQRSGELIEESKEQSPSYIQSEPSFSSVVEEFFEQSSSSEYSSDITVAPDRSEASSQAQSKPQSSSQTHSTASSEVSSAPQVEQPPVIPDPPAESSSPPAESSPSVSVPDSQDSGSNQLSYARQVVELVNQQRVQNGLSPLTLNTQVETAAKKRSQEIVSSFSHTRPNGSSFSTVLAEQGISYRSSGENIAWGQRSPEQVMQGWMNSSGHRANILSSKFTQIGVGCYRASNGVLYWTQLFIG